MAKYNITEKKEKEAAYRTLVSPGLMRFMELGDAFEKAARVTLKGIVEI